MFKKEILDLTGFENLSGFFLVSFFRESCLKVKFGHLKISLEIRCFPAA